MLPVSIRIFKMDALIYILLFIIISLLILSILILHYIVKFLHTMQANFLKDIQLGVNYIYSNQSKINYIYKRLKERKKE
jgi:hypothetical protein